VFLFVDDVEPRGGTTLVIRSSHKRVAKMIDNTVDLVDVKQSVMNQRFVASGPWLATLKKSNRLEESFNQYYMAVDTEIDGVGLRVVELTGTRCTGLKKCGSLVYRN